MSTTASGQRRRTNRKASEPCVIRLELKDSRGNPRWVTADLVDTSEHGIGVSLVTPLAVGSILAVRGKLGKDQTDTRLRAGVTWCVEETSGGFRAGLEFLNGSSGFVNDQPRSAPEDPGELDCYEVLQLSPNADVETIGRVYRILAQRYHPDNAQTGNSEQFVRLTQAYRILSDPEQRASYDARHRQGKQLHWEIFDQARVTTGREGEKRKRQGILGLLYAKALHDPENAAMTLHAFEGLLACPREHLRAALWYLKGKGYIQRTDSGRYTITVPGFEEAEEHCPVMNAEYLLPEPESPPEGTPS